MKNLINIILLLACGAAFAGPEKPFREVLSKDLLNEEIIHRTIDDLIQKRNKYKDQRNYVEWIYYKVHRRHLKRYKQYSSMDETLLEGKYDCVTGTALYAAIYSTLGFNLEIKESTYHIYLIVETSNGKALIESTDPINGVITDPEIINAWVSGNVPLNVEPAGEQVFESISNKNITMQMLAGLLHFNQAVRFFNEGNYTRAMGYIEAAIKQYPSDRMFQMAAIVAQGMRSSATVDPIIAQIYCEKYLSESLSIVTTN